MRLFYLHWGISQTASAKLAHRSSRSISQTVSAKSGLVDVPVFPLSWSHYVRLLSVPDEDARKHYEKEALRGGWSVRQLDRQISTLSFHRSRSEQVAGKHEGNPDFEIKDPFVLEFLGLKDEYSEAELEEALIRELEQFLLELGNDFAFIARQKRLRVGTEWYRVDLLFLHRRLRSLIVVELKLGKFTHADAGQMNLYLNYAREHWTNPEENPPIGLILCSEHEATVAQLFSGQSRQSGACTGIPTCIANRGTARQAVASTASPNRSLTIMLLPLAARNRGINLQVADRPGTTDDKGVSDADPPGERHVGYRQHAPRVGGTGSVGHREPLRSALDYQKLRLRLKLADPDDRKVRRSW